MGWRLPNRVALPALLPHHRPRKGSVKLVFEAPDGEEVHFERAIKPAGAAAETFTSEVGAARFVGHHKQKRGQSVARRRDG